MQESSIINRFEDLRKNKESELIDIEINKNRIILDNLVSQKEILQMRLDDLEFQLEEMKCAPKNPKNTPEMKEETFFALLSRLEEQENKLIADVENKKKFLRDLSHKNGIITQKNTKLKEELNILNEKKNRALLAEWKTKDELNNLKASYLEKNDELNSVISNFEEIHNELKQKTEGMSIEKESELNELRKRKREYLETLMERQQEEKTLKESLAQSERQIELQKRQNSMELQRIESVASWQNQRKVLMTKLNVSKSKLDAELNSMESARKREAALIKQFKALLGDDDPGNGTGKKAKEILLSAIEYYENQIHNELDCEISAEISYQNELTEQKKLLENSLQVFKEYQNDLLTTLDEDQRSAAEKGFISLLSSELANISEKCNKIGYQ